MHHLLDCLLILQLTQEDFFLPAWKIQHQNRLTFEINRCVLHVRCMCPALSFSYSVSLPKLLAAGCVLLLAVNMSKRSIWVHFVRKECIKKIWSPDIQTVSQDKGIDQGTLCMCRQTYSNLTSIVAPLSSIDYFRVVVFPWKLCGPTFSFLYHTAEGTLWHFSSVTANTIPCFICWCMCLHACLDLSAVTLLRLSRHLNDKR